MRPPLLVRVPGSTSNLGPGFDCLGLALTLFLEARLSPCANDAGTHSLGAVAGPDFEPEGVPGALLLHAFTETAERLGVEGSFVLEVRSEIPVARGFGSSGAAVAAGLLLARAVAARPVELAQLLTWGVALEGHPDNVTASLLGGCTVCHPAADENGPAWLGFAPAESLGFAVAWPTKKLTTAEARAVLPGEVPFADAVENPRRLALLLEGLRHGDPRLLAAGGEDRLHERHRLPLIPGGAAALAAARAVGAWLATISGAGSGLIAVGPRDRAPAIASAMENALRAVEGGAGSRVVQPVLGAPSVEPGG